MKRIFSLILAGLAFVCSAQASQVIDARTFGAKFDGSTNDTVAIGKALAAVPAGGTLYMAPGTSVATISIRRSDINIQFDGTTLKHPAGATNIVLELGDTASGNSAIAYENINVLGRVLLDGNKANVTAPGSDLTGHCFAATKISKSYWQHVRAKNCWNAGAGIFIDSNYNEGHFYVENSGNVTFTAPGFDINSSKYGYYTVISNGNYDGARILDNVYGVIINATILSATRHGFICSNQAVNESFLNTINVSVDTTGNNGVIFGANCRNNTIRASVRLAGDTGMTATLFAAVTKTFDGSSGAVVSTLNDTITIAAHGFLTGQPLVYSPGGGTVIVGLTGGQTYYAILVDANTIKLASSRANATAGTQVDLTALGTGVAHTLISDQSARSNNIVLDTFRSANQGVFMGGVNNDWTITSDQDGRSGGVGAVFAVDVNGNYNTIRLNHHDTAPWKVRGVAVRAGATGNTITGYQWDNTADPWNDAGTSTLGPNGRPFDSKGFTASLNGGFTLARNAPTYGVSVAIDASLGSEFDITATNGVAFTVANPTNAADGKRITITVRNGSGGALGAITWDTLYKLAAWTSPANANSRSIDFKYNGTNWVEVGRTTVDVPN